MMEKCEVNGTDCHEVFKYLRCNSSLWDAKKKVAKEIPWNFAKFLMSGDGKVIQYFSPRVDPVALISHIEQRL